MKKIYVWVLVIIIVVVAVVLSNKSKSVDEISTKNTTENMAHDEMPVIENNQNTIINTEEIKTSEDSIVKTTEDKASTTKSFTVTGTNFSFGPNMISVNKGDTVNITFVNSSGFHDLKIDEFAVATKQISAGKEETVTFIADKAGTFEYYCSVGTHRAMGMKGTLVVK